MTSGLAAALMAGGALVQAAPIAQADGIIPCGTYHNAGDGLVYWGNCTFQDTRISVSQPGIQAVIQCARKERGSPGRTQSVDRQRPPRGLLSCTV